MSHQPEAPSTVFNDLAAETLEPGIGVDTEELLGQHTLDDIDVSEAHWHRAEDDARATIQSIAIESAPHGSRLRAERRTDLFSAAQQLVDVAMERHFAATGHESTAGDTELDIEIENIQAKILRDFPGLGLEVENVTSMMEYVLDRMELVFADAAKAGYLNQERMNALDSCAERMKTLRKRLGPAAVLVNPMFSRRFDAGFLRIRHARSQHLVWPR